MNLWNGTESSRFDSRFSYNSKLNLKKNNSVEFHTQNSDSVPWFNLASQSVSALLVWLLKHQIFVYTQRSGCEESNLGVKPRSQTRHSNERLTGLCTSEVLYPEPCSREASTASVETVKCVVFQKYLIFNLQCLQSENYCIYLRQDAFHENLRPFTFFLVNRIRSWLVNSNRVWGKAMYNLAQVVHMGKVFV